MRWGVGRLQDWGVTLDVLADKDIAVFPKRSFVYRMGQAPRWRFRPATGTCPSDLPHTNATMRTTIVSIILQTGVKASMLPAHAEATLATPSLLRLLKTTIPPTSVQ